LEVEEDCGRVERTDGRGAVVHEEMERRSVMRARVQGLVTVC